MTKGIFFDLVQLFDNKSKPKSFLRWYTSSRLYYKQHISDSPRYNLDFQIVGYVTKEEFEKVQLVIKNAKEKQNNN